MNINKAKTVPIRRKKATFETKARLGQESIVTYSNDTNPRIYSILHDTSYKYKVPVSASNHLLRMQPVQDLYQSVLHYELDVTPKCKETNFTGVFGNHASYIEISKPYTALKIKSRSIVAICDRPEINLDFERQNTIPLIWMPWDQLMLQNYLVPPELSEAMLLELSRFAMSFIKTKDQDALEVLNDINMTIYNEFDYVPGITNIFTTPYEVLVARKGVCADFANLFICLARLLNIPARYRMGYVYTGKTKTSYRSGASHAWVEIYLPNIGWIGFDPTNGCMEGKNHIRIATGRNYRDATPSSGTLFRDRCDTAHKEPEEKLITSVQVDLLNTKSI